MKFFRDSKSYGLLFLPVVFVISLLFSPVFVEAAVQDEGIDRGISDKLVEPTIPDKDLRSTDRFWEETDRFVLIGDVQAYGSYSDLEGDDLWGGSFYGIIAPGYKVGPRMIFIAMYDGQYDRRMDLYSDDYGYKRTTESQRHSITPMLRIDFGDDSRYTLTPSAFFTKTWNKDESQNASWDAGLYNYEDEGMALDFDMRRCLGENGEFKISAQYYAREYPNYTNLLYEYDPLNPFSTYEDEKDYHGIIGEVRYSWIKAAGFSWSTEYTLLYKRLCDKLITKSNGVLSSSEKQRDYIHEMDLNFWYFFDDIAGGLNLGLDLGYRIYKSNENFLLGTTPANYDVNKDFFDYKSYRIVPNVSYIFELIPLTARLSYAYESLDYTDRWAKDRAGSWAAKDEQWEHRHNLVFGLRFEFSEKLSFMTQWEYIKTRSNNDDESVYEYDYRVNNFLLGAKYTF